MYGMNAVVQVQDKYIYVERVMHAFKNAWIHM